MSHFFEIFIKNSAESINLVILGLNRDLKNDGTVMIVPSNFLPPIFQFPYKDSFVEQMRCEPTDRYNGSTDGRTDVHSGLTDGRTIKLMERERQKDRQTRLWRCKDAY